MRRLRPKSVPFLISSMSHLVTSVCQAMRQYTLEKMRQFLTTLDASNPDAYGDVDLIEAQLRKKLFWLYITTVV